ncbi:unnamed protein product [Paramecium pentaurelia]|uniref:Metal-dependent protein hydrolase n=1 Tax=Paramecium pentaurelia TaxID=43138 RepID=A0A8S1VTE2_9CILI|nr:unnamed protein product [Paramecium pentaurelia]
MQQVFKKIGTHNGAFHVDEVLACAMLTKYTNEFKNGIITRSRDPNVWAQQDILVDVGGVYDPQTHRYDHHQKEFQDSFSKDFKIRLSSAGLIYKHFGLEIIQNLISHINDTVETTIEIQKVDEKTLNLIYIKLYKNFIQSIDAIDNGINQFPNQDQIKYQINTHLSAVINRFNPTWCEKNQDENAKFHQALEFVNTELISQMKSIYLGWYPGRYYVVQAYDSRLEQDQSGQILKLQMALPWKSHIFDIEQERGTVGLIKFVLYPDRNEGWRVQAVSVNEDSFENRKSLKKEWRGVKDIEQLKEISGIDDIVFVHASGFIGGARSYENALKMAKLSLE